MPGQDKRGPQGMGPMTGRKRGLCAQAARERMAAREINEQEQNTDDNTLVDEISPSEAEESQELDYSRRGDGQGLGMGRQHHGGYDGEGQGRGYGCRGYRGRRFGSGRGRGAGIGLGRKGGNR